MSREGRVPTSQSQEHEILAGDTPTTALNAQSEHLGATSSSSIPSALSQKIPQYTSESAQGLESELEHVRGGLKPSSPSTKRDLPSESASQSTDEAAARPRQVIAVSASKGPAAFFNLARKFLVTDEMCDLSALEGAIVSAVDAAHLLERSKLATITRIQTSYVTVEPKRRKQAPSTPGGADVGTAQDVSPAPSPDQAAQSYKAALSPSATEAQTRRTSSGRELRRARIVITVRRTESYKKWLEDNPLQAIIAGDTEEVEGADDEH